MRVLQKQDPHYLKSLPEFSKYKSISISFAEVILAKVGLSEIATSA